MWVRAGESARGGAGSPGGGAAREPTRLAGSCTGGRPDPFFPIMRTMSDSYYHSHDLPRFSEMANDAPDLGKKFFDYYNAVFADGALSEREKSLIALAVAHAVQCPYCIDAYAQDCLAKGSDVEQMTEAVHVAVAIRGGASLVHGLQMRNVVQKMSL